MKVTFNKKWSLFKHKWLNRSHSPIGESIEGIGSLESIIFGATTMWACHSSTLITKILIASALHTHTTYTLLHPKFTSRTLLKFCPSGKSYKRLIFWAHAPKLLVLWACHILVEIAPAFQTIPFAAIPAIEVRDLRIELKHQVAIGCGTPWGISSIFLNILVHHEVLIFFLKFWRHEIK